MRMLLLIVFGSLIQFATAQEFKANPLNSHLSVTGTSTLHDWECTVEHFKGNVFATLENEQIKNITKFDFQFKVKSLKSGKSSMDKKTYEALKEEEHPTISYRGTQVNIQGNIATFIGIMNIAGVKKEVETKVKLQYHDGQLILEGEKEFQLTDFSIEPPTAVFGTIKTGDLVTIHYKIQLKTNNK